MQMKPLSEYTYGHNVYKETYPQRKERALSEVLEQIKNYPLPLSDNDTKWDDLLRERDLLWSKL